MNVHDEEKQFRKFRERYGASHMSNAKWRKLFETTSDFEPWTLRSSWRSSRNPDRVSNHCLPAPSDLCETGLRDGRLTPLEFKWILSIEILHEYRPDAKRDFVQQQPTMQLFAKLNQVARFPIELTEDGLLITAYSPLRSG